MKVADEQRVTEDLISTIDSEPFEYFDAIRSTEPIRWDADMKAWVVSSYELAREVMLRDKMDFRQPYADMMTEAMIAIQGGPRSRNFLHGETHARFHHWMIAQFHPRVVERWRKSLIRPVADELIGRFAERGHADLMKELADPLPVRVIAAMMDLPWRDDEWIERCKSLMEFKLIYLQNQGREEDPEIARQTIDAMEELDDLLRPFVRERRDGAGDDFISQTWRDGPSLFADWGEKDTLSMAASMFFSGSDTTMHTLANAFFLLLDDIELQEKVRAGDKKVLESFAEEALRLHGAVHFRLRYANHDTELAGVKIKKDEMVLNLHAAANRDPAAIECPHDVKLDRRRAKEHMAFSVGPRKCAGAALARVEIQEGVRALLDWFPKLTFNDEVDYARRPPYLGFTLRSYSEVHAKFDPVTTAPATAAG